MLLFSYGTRCKTGTCRCELRPRADEPRGYLCRIHGGWCRSVTRNANAEGEFNLEDTVSGMVIQNHGQELAAADEYEDAEYSRIFVTARSGAQAWVCVKRQSRCAVGNIKTLNWLQPAQNSRQGRSVRDHATRRSFYPTHAPIYLLNDSDSGYRFETGGSARASRPGLTIAAG